MALSPARAPRAITFDLDDTLWPVMPAIAAAERALLAWLGEHCPRVIQRHDAASLAQLRARIQLRHPELGHDFSMLRRLAIAEILDDCGYPESLVDPAFDVFFEARCKVTLYDDVIPALERLGTRFRLAAITNGNACIRRAGVDRYLDFSIHAREAGHAKPSPKIFEIAARRFGLPAADILHVGDHPEQDFEGARAAGFQAVWLNRSDDQSSAQAPMVPCLMSLADQLLGEKSVAQGEPQRL